MSTPVTAKPAQSVLRWLYDAYTQTQRLRIAIGNRIGAVEREADGGPLTPAVERLFADLARGELGLRRDMERALVGHPAMAWLGRVKGIGPTLGTKLLGLIDDISTFTTASKLWRFAGLAVIDGKRERPQGAFCPHCGKRGRQQAHVCPVAGTTLEIKGEKLHYNVKLKTTLYLVAGSFLKCDSPYVRIYRDARVRYLARATGQSESWNRAILDELWAAEGPARVAVERRIEAARLPESWTSGHQHLAALRVMEKLFLVHLWKTWREALGLPTPAPYVVAHPTLRPHSEELDPWDFVEPDEG